MQMDPLTAKLSLDKDSRRPTLAFGAYIVSMTMAWRKDKMNAVIAAVVMGLAFLALAVWIEIRERRVSPRDGEYRSAGSLGA